MVFYRGLGKYYKQDWEQAALDFDRAFELDRSLLHAQIGKALSYFIRHQGQKGLALLRAAEEKINERGVSDPEAIYKVAQAYGILGDRASALRVLQSSISSGFFPYPYLMSDPLLNSVRSEREFDRLMAVARQRHESFKRKFL
jgi:tetratricopeptide (TPR) repeat protein